MDEVVSMRSVPSDSQKDSTVVDFGSVLFCESFKSTAKSLVAVIYHKLNAIYNALFVFFVYCLNDVSSFVHKSNQNIYE